jgi:hypothetical protein
MASGNEKLASAFWRRVEQDGGFDFGKSYDNESEVPQRVQQADRL